MDIYLLVSDPVLLAVIALIGTLLTLLTQIIMAYIQNKVRKEQKEGREEQKVLTAKVDGRLTDLLEETKKSSQLLGHKEGVAEQKEESKVAIASAPPIELKIGKLEVELKPPTTPPEEKK